MRYAEYLPSPGLASLVDAYWVLEGMSDGVPEPIFPDGRVELIFHYGERFRRHHPEGTLEHQPRALLAGPTLAPVVVSHAGRAGVAAIRLRPAAVRAVLGVTGASVAGRIEDLESLFPSVRGLCERLYEAATDRDRVARLEAWLSVAHPRTPRPDVSWTADAIVHSGGRAGIAALAARGGVTVRTLERRFLDEVGLTPKQFARVIRLQRALGHVRSGAPLADVAIGCGYYDQSHMVLDFQRLAAVSPRGWRAHAGVLAPMFAGCE